MTRKLLISALAILGPIGLFASGGAGCTDCFAIMGIRLEFIFFALTLIGVALFHNHTLKVALTGLVVVLGYKLIFDPTFHLGHHFFGENPILEQITDKHARQGEWSILLNLFGLLIGFALLANHFEESKVPSWIPKILPGDWKGGLLLLVMVFVLSSFLDNIAAAMIGGTIAWVVFDKKVRIGYLAAIVAASNAGGSGSVVGDTTTTMMWIDGVSALNVIHAYIAAFVALLVFAFIAAKQQEKYQKMLPAPTEKIKIEFNRIVVVLLILVGTIITNIMFDFPALGVWVAIVIGAFFVKTHWNIAKEAILGSVFLLSLVTIASMMPVETLPEASWSSAFILGFVSAVFDNIPLTKLALDQGGYDWGMLAYAVGFGGSMIWFGSSAGVAISNMYKEAKNVASWVKDGWYVTVAYIVGFFALYYAWGWEPAETGKLDKDGNPKVQTEQVVHE